MADHKVGTEGRETVRRSWLCMFEVIERNPQTIFSCCALSANNYVVVSADNVSDGAKAISDSK